MSLPAKLTAFLVLAAVTPALTGKPKPVPATVGHAVPPPPVELMGTSGSLLLASLAPENQYSIGSPSDEEQALVELINRARADANAEALRLANTTDQDVLDAICFFGVNLPEMINQFATLPQSLPPLSIHSELTQMARLHSQDMLDNIFQGHTSSDSPPAPYSAGDSLSDRAAEFVYPYTSLGENVYAYSKSDYYGHASFEIDWGFDALGMQSPPEHRETIHNASYREVGIGIVKGTNSTESQTVGPMLMTQVFGEPQSGSPFITGVAYYDLNANGFYDAGEGLGGLTVSTEETTAWALTANSGGYSIPVPSDGSYTVTFSGLGITPQTTVVNVASGENVKQDFAIGYVPPVLNGSTTPFTGIDNEYAISPTPGATGYWFKVYTENVTTWLEGAENGTAAVTIVNSPEYVVIQSEVVRNGTYAFHFAHPGGGSDQTITLQQIIFPTASSELRFGSKLQYATSSQTANVDVSTDEGITWTNIYRQTGSNSSGEAGFVYRFVSLGSYAGQPLRIRFRYSVEGCNPSIYDGITTNIGWIIDDITVANATRLLPESELILGTPTAFFNPATGGEFYLTARPVNNFKGFPYGPLLKVTAGPAGPQDLWRLDNFLQADLNDPAKESTVWGNLADPDKDGLG
ncbi:MAG: CAP domain-containing protein, partial [Puniceicoccaceae bacterium]